MADRSTNRIHIYDHQLQEVDTIVFRPEVVPHVIDFDSQFRYAFIANSVRQRGGDPHPRP